MRVTNKKSDSSVVASLVATAHEMAGVVLWFVRKEISLVLLIGRHGHGVLVPVASASRQRPCVAIPNLLYYRWKMQWFFGEVLLLLLTRSLCSSLRRKRLLEGREREREREGEGGREGMGKLSISRALECFSLSIATNTCFCMNSLEDHDDEFEGKALIRSDEMIKLREIFEGNKTLAFHLEPKTVVLRVSMHCNGCARKVQKHISKMEGVTSFEVDLESKKVVVIGDITPFEVLESVSKVNKFAELWMAP